MAATVCGAQLVGFSMKSGRSTVTPIVRMSSGTPSSIAGSGSLVTVSCAVCGSTATFARMITSPRSNGPASAGTTTLNPNGAPS